MSPLGRSRRHRRIPLVLQSCVADCGAACLTMVLRQRGVPAALSEVRRDLGSSRDGLSALDLVRAARRRGLSARAFSVPPQALARAPGAIVHWEFNHFLVLERWSPSRVLVLDPAAGRRRMSAVEFAAGFTGVVVVAGDATSPGGGERVERRPWRAQLARAVLLRHRGLWSQVLATSALLQLLGLAVPVVMRLVVDHGPGAGGDLLTLLALGLAAAVLARTALDLLRAALLSALRARADAELSTTVVQRLLALPFAFFAQRGSADLVLRVGSVSTVRETIAGSVLPALLDGPLAVGYLVLLTTQDRVLGAALTAVVLLQVWLLLATRRRISALAQQELVAASAAQGFLAEGVRGIETLKAAGAEERAVQQWRRRFTAQLTATSRTQLTAGAVDAASGGLQLLAPLALLLLGAWRVRGGDLSLGEALGAVALGTLALTPVTSLAASLQLVQVAGAHLERLADLFEAEPERSGSPGTAPAAPTAPGGPAAPGGALEVRELGFRHHPGAGWTLRDVSFTAHPGQKIALVGRSGCGKTTLARLLLALYPPTEGEVLHDGVATGRWDLTELRRRFGAVVQEPVLFTGTVRENIALGDPTAPLARVVDAARCACLHEEVEALPMGYETVLTEGGGLSGGQRQRVALARALLTRPRVLVLDEATSHLDAATEAAIEANLARLPQTRIVIAHRLSTVRDADLILVLDRGRVVERGTHADLLRLGGEYAGLAALQGTAPA
ncbi:peptidase domain-containing ABC transporter [Kineococcus indalonis]|uniref:peptidase domain-containing ABC transporter n=1 Tax=Kineococcus indalonis TaxID=2696566 RepID=UPI00196B64E1|nr:peptidase domain-containing ABC transporter [Kineococcus indalonis]